MVVVISATYDLQSQIWGKKINDVTSCDLATRREFIITYYYATLLSMLLLIFFLYTFAFLFSYIYSLSLFSVYICSILSIYLTYSSDFMACMRIVFAFIYIFKWKWKEVWFEIKFFFFLLMKFQLNSKQSPHKYISFAIDNFQLLIFVSFIQHLFLNLYLNYLLNYFIVGISH